MAHDAVLPASPGRPERHNPPAHDRLMPNRWTGTLEVVLEFPKKHPLVIGAGWLELHREKSQERILASQVLRRNRRARRPTARYKETLGDPELVSEIVRSSPEAPVIPGSSLKGAVRQIYELLTPSCGWNHSCAVSPKTPLHEAEVCPACSMFGCTGYMGRLRVQEATAGQGVRIEKRTVPFGWPPQNREPGHLRVYDNRRATDSHSNLRDEEEVTFATWGSYHVRLTLLNANDDELGLLLASLGIGWGGPGPGLRLGGKKYHGFGAASTRLVRSEKRAASLGEEPTVRKDDEAQRWGLDLQGQALDREPARRTAWNKLHEVMQLPEGTADAES